MRATCSAPTVKQIVAVDHRKYDVRESEQGDGACDMLRLSNVEGALWVAGGNRAESAPARAYLS